MKTTKAEILKALKEKGKKLSEEDKKKFGPELVAAIENATEDDLELNETSMLVQVGHFDINYTGVCENSSMTRTINDTCSMPTAIWIKDKFLVGKAKAAETNKKQTVNERDAENHYANIMYEVAKNALGLDYGDPKCIFGYDGVLVDNYVTRVVRDYCYGLNMSYKSSRVNKRQFVAETDEAVISMMVVWLHYKKNGKDCVCFVGRVDDVLGKHEEEIVIAIDPTIKKYKSHAKGKRITWAIIVLGVIAAAVAWFLLK